MDGWDDQAREPAKQKADAPLLLQGRQIPANAAKRLGSGPTAEGAGDLLLHFDHPKIPLRKFPLLLAALASRHTITIDIGVDEAQRVDR